MQPRIGISCANMHIASAQAMVKRVSEAGGVPVLLTDHGARDERKDFEGMQGLVVMGGDYDIDPIHYMNRYPEGDQRRKIHPLTRSELESPEAKARGKYENALMKRVLRAGMPMLCICGGMQRLNVLCGGTLIQHVPDMAGHARLAIIAKKTQLSFVKCRTPGLAAVVMGNGDCHQSIDTVGEGLRICALSETVRLKDGSSRYLVEAVEGTPEGSYGKQFLIGVQWYPEFCASDIGRVLMNDFIQHATNFRL